MNQTQIDNLVGFLWNQYSTGNKDVDCIITGLLNDLKQQLIGMKDDR